jgi:hypothetical protein
MPLNPDQYRAYAQHAALHVLFGLHSEQITTMIPLDVLHGAQAGMSQRHNWMVTTPLCLKYATEVRQALI